MTIFIILLVLVLVAGGIYALYRYQLKNTENLFTQIYESSRMVPKQKKNSFILLMFKEAMQSSKKKDNANLAKLNNPQFLEKQLLQMTLILKNPANVTDKKMKRALRMLEDYQKWERNKNTQNKGQEKPKSDTKKPKKVKTAK